MVKIKNVMPDNDDGLPLFGAALIIDLNNAQTIFLSLESKADDPLFAPLRRNRRLFTVKTDGDSIYWSDGPRLTLDEIMDMLREDGEGNA